MRALGTYGLLAVNLLLIQILAVSAAWSQPPNNSCSNATELCPEVTVSSTNEDANATVCPDCEDDFNFCFAPRNSVWFSFTTNSSGGDVTVNLSNLVFVMEANRGTQLQAAIVRPQVACNASTYTLSSNCETGAAGNFSLTATALAPSTKYYVVVTGQFDSSTNGLPAEASFDIIASGPGIDRPSPAVYIGGPGTQLCPQQSVTFYASPVNCPDSTGYTWKINGETAAVTQEPTWFTSLIEDGDLVSVETSCYANCPVSISGQYGPVSVENLVVDAGPDQFLAEGETTHLNGSTNGTSWIWSPGNTLSDPSSLQPIAYPENTTSYFLTASSANCTLSDEVIITMNGKFSVPGSFSPNGDGVNDTWMISGIDAYPNANVLLFDRWGQQIADIVGYSSEKSWDGTYNGKAVTDGVYFYHIDLRDASQDKPLTGYVTVLR